MIYFLALIPATALAIAGYFALYLSHRSQGTFQALGKYLGFWAFTLAGLVILGALFAAAQGRHHGGMMYEHMHRHWSGDPRFPGPEPSNEGANGEAPRAAGPPAPADAPPAKNPTLPPR